MIKLEIPPWQSLQTPARHEYLTGHKVHTFGQKGRVKWHKCQKCDQLNQKEMEAITNQSK